MHWEYKLQALNAIADCHLIMRKPGDWYVSAEMSIKKDGGCTLVGEFGNGNSPQSAVDQHWDKYSELDSDHFVVAKKYGKRVAVRWNGFMWDHVEESAQAA